MTHQTPLSICAKCAHTPICKNHPQQSCSYFWMKGDFSRRMAEKDLPKSSNNSFLRKVWTCCLWVLVLGLLLGAFLAGHYSARTQLVTSLITASPSPNTTPDQVVQQFFEAIMQQDAQRVLTLCHPDLQAYDRAELVEEMKDPAGDYATLARVTIEQIDEASTVIVSLTRNDGRVNSVRVALRRYQNQWLIRDL